MIILALCMQVIDISIYNTLNVYNTLDVYSMYNVKYFRNKL